MLGEEFQTTLNPWTTLKVIDNKSIWQKFAFASTQTIGYHLEFIKQLISNRVDWIKFCKLLKQSKQFVLNQKSVNIQG